MTQDSQAPPPPPHGPPPCGLGWWYGSSGPPPLWPVVVVWFFWSPPCGLWWWYVGMLVCWYVGMLVCWYVCMYVCMYVCIQLNVNVVESNVVVKPRRKIPGNIPKFLKNAITYIFLLCMNFFFGHMNNLLRSEVSSCQGDLCKDSPPGWLCNSQGRAQFWGFM